MFIAVVATTTLFDRGHLHGDLQQRRAAVEHHGLVVYDLAAAICAIRRLASKLRYMRSSKAAAGESTGKAIAPPCVLINCFFASRISRSDLMVTSETPKFSARWLVRACAGPLKFEHDLMSPLFRKHV